MIRLGKLGHRLPALTNCITRPGTACSDPLIHLSSLAHDHALQIPALYWDADSTLGPIDDPMGWKAIGPAGTPPVEWEYWRGCGAIAVRFSE